MFLTSCATSSGSESAPPATSTLATDAYHIGVDDIVQVSVWRNPELGITVPVRPDGMISVPLVGDVAAGGRTPAEVAKDIEAHGHLRARSAGGGDPHRPPQP